MPQAALFVTCLVDMFRPTIGFATVKLLEDAGCEVVVPEGQTCCGQPAFNTGDRETTKKLAKHTIEVFEGQEYVVLPSGSCAGMVKEHYPELFDDDSGWKARAEDLAERTWELTSFLTDVLGVTGVETSLEVTATFHDSCHGLRELGIREQPRRILDSVEGLELIEMNASEACCGFGGTFCVKYPDISVQMAGEKAKNIEASGADLVLGGDYACLMNIAGYLKRQGSEVQVRHLAEILAGMCDGPAIGEDGSVKPTSRSFVSNVKTAVADNRLHAAVVQATDRFVTGRQRAADAFPDFEGLRNRAKAIKEHSIAHLDHYLEAFESKIVENGGTVHWAHAGAEANAVITGICRDAGAARVTKSKSMVSEEIALNDALEAEDIEVTETDLGEYIIQLAGEHPSHIIAPAIHRNRHDVEALFREKHADLGDQPLDTVSALVAESRRVLRQRFLAADVGITGANFLIAETGSFVVVTNEGNADLTANLPRVHIVIASIEKVLPTLEDVSTMLRILARSCTGQESSVYTTLFTGPKRAGDPDGPEELHVVLLDNGRVEMLGTDFQEMLRCIKCSACLNHCPVYNAIGGHAYGWVYTGPMGAVLSPLLIGLEETHHLPNASSLCGACGEVCPVKIPLPELLRKHREIEFEEKITPPRWRAGLRAWGWLASNPRLYHMATSFGMRSLSMMAGRRGRLSSVPLAGGWTDRRDMPAPEGRTFMAQWKNREALR